MPQAQDTAHKNACRECQYEEPTGGGHCHQNKDHKPDREDQPRDALTGILLPISSVRFSLCTAMCRLAHAEVFRSAQASSTL